MNHTATRSRFARPALRDLVATQIYPRYSMLKAALSPGRGDVQSACRAGLEFRKSTDGWTEECKSEWVLDRLRLAVRRAYHHTDYYREQYDRLGFDPLADFGFREFASLPVLEKDDIREAGARLISDEMPASRLHKDSTGGSTGVPVEVWLGPEERGWRQSASEWVFKLLGVPAGSRTAYLWGHHLDPQGGSSLREKAYFYFNNAEWFDCFRLDSDVLDLYHERLEKFRPACIIAYATALGALADHILERGYHPRYPTRFILTGAEKLFTEHRQWAEAAFGCPVFERYGGRDVGPLAFQSNRVSDHKFEIDWANVMIEPESDEPEASILVTKLHADGMPMIRYRIGDMGLFPKTARPGYPALFLDEVTGREPERIWAPDGSWVQGTALPHLMKDYPVREYMLVQSEDYSVELQLVPRRGFGEQHKVEIIRTLSSNLKGLTVSATLVDRIPRTKANKLRSIVSKVSRNARSYGV